MPTYRDYQFLSDSISKMGQGFLQGEMARRQKRLDAQEQSRYNTAQNRLDDATRKSDQRYQAQQEKDEARFTAQQLGASLKNLTTWASMGLIGEKGIADVNSKIEEAYGVRLDFKNLKKARSSVLGKIMDDLDQEKDPINRKLLMTKAKNEAARGGWSIEFGEDGKVSSIRQGGAGTQGAGLEKSTRGFIQKHLKAREKSMDELEMLSSMIEPGSVGFRGWGQEWILNRGLGQLFPGLKDMKVTDARTQLKLLKEGILRKVSDDTRFNLADRKAIEEIMPSDGVLEDSDRAKQALERIKMVFANRNLMDRIEVMGGFHPETISNKYELRAAVFKGLITPEQATAVWNRRTLPVIPPAINEPINPPPAPMINGTDAAINPRNPWRPN